ncbi:hypothetical protein C6P40_001123 [Pichia californica]|uniref:Uncharacterized protein n=1 Tax=Pichia californica TaxID=460514 RepID=A0A9P6WLI1_9ASCO|nr:hypothetical protein C6P42_001065 [[Candida] californica]KAG0688327.1 hypothetical protein C6P40_001123 [[Candida] californica]
MAPALPVYSREEIERIYPKIFKKEEDKKEINRDNIPNNCEIYELIQNQCTYDGNMVYCLPFKRIFLRCLENNKERDIIGYKLTPLHRNNNSNISGRFEINGSGNNKDGKYYRDIEITVESDNDYKYNEGVENFLKADDILRGKMKEYYDKMKIEEEG